MPRQITPLQLAEVKRIGKSPVPILKKRARVGDKLCSVEPDGRMNKIGKVINSLNKSGQIAQADKNMSMKEMSRTIMSSIGAGVVTEISKDTVSKEHDIGTKIKLKTGYSLKMTETDNTVIPNPNITDIKSVKKQFSKAPMIPATVMFQNFSKNTLFEPQPQEELKEVYLRQQKLKTAETSNLIDIVQELNELQFTLKSDAMLPVFKITQQFVANPTVDNSNLEFKDFSNPNLNFDFDEDEVIKI
tara:strand:+ start:11133 stop:11867 length:735 start_codon:yes stop_codon:yes gene_type:complete